MGASGAAVGSLADFLGVPTGVANLEVSALPFRAYALCYNEFYRDQDLIDPVTIDLTGGPDTTTNTDLLRAAWQKDYFTTCRPDTQKGDDVSIALSGDADVTTDADNNDFLGVKSTTQSNAIKSMDTDGGAADRLRLGNNTEPDVNKLYADLSNVEAVSINDLRLATSLQRYKENMLRYGARYAERLAHAFGIRNADGRLQRPEYLGGGKNIIQFSEIPQTAPSIDDRDWETYFLYNVVKR